MSCLHVWGQAPTAAGTAKLLHDLELDPASCYRINEIHFAKEDVSVYLSAGYLIFAKPVFGFRSAAVFTAEAPGGGDGEILILPPNRAERTSLAGFTHSPTLDEHFRSSAMIFTDDTGADLLRLVSAAGSANGFTRKDPEVGAILAAKWSPVVRNLSSSYDVRLVHDLLSGAPATGGLFFMALHGNALGNIDVVYDPTVAKDIVVGQMADRRNRTYFDTWTSFPPKSLRSRRGEAAQDPFTLDNFRIQATILPDLSMQVTTRATLTLRRTAPRILPFFISNGMRVTSASMDGGPAEVFQRASERDNLLLGGGNNEFLVVPAQPLVAARSYEIEFQHEGAVISQTADGVYYVGARGTWYPQLGTGLARFDVTYRYPKSLDLVANGEVVADHTEGDWRTTRSVTSSPIRFAGFNLGEYRHVSATTGPYRIQVCANLRASGSHPDSQLQKLTGDVVSAFDFMTGEFGPPPIHTLTVSPIPGLFGQGFPGLVYLSTLAYLDPGERPKELRDRFEQTFFTDMLDAHEIAHQWWGNLVAPASYEDEWLMESLANYSALLYLEKKKGRKALDAVLDDYRNHLTAKSADGHTPESAGPITWGTRLESSLAPDAWRLITYEKGSWIIHMLRLRLGDDKFLAMLREACRRYQLKVMSTEQFRLLASEYANGTQADKTLSNFFENWVYGTGIPSVKLSYTVRGLIVSGTLTGAGGNPEFAGAVPLEIQSGKERLLYWLDSGPDAVPFKISLRQKPTKVALNPAGGLFTVAH